MTLSISRAMADQKRLALRRPARAMALLRRLRPLGFGALAVANAAWSVVQVIGSRRLRNERQRALDLASARGGFLRLVSHEIRTPLAVARGYVDIVRSGTLGTVNDEVRNALGSVEEKLCDIEELVGHMIETARLEAGSGQLRLERLDLRTVLDEALSRTAELRGPRHPVTVDVPNRPLLVECDHFRLRTVLCNMLTNAVKYSPDGGPIRCTVRRARRRAEVSVADRGIGIAPEQVEQVFRPFTRLPGAASATGLGLGLHIAREVARAHGGDLDAHPNAGGGSVFVLSMPLGR
jgi:signal transduction histidine kinase